MAVLQKSVSGSWVDFPTPVEIGYTRSAMDASSSGRNQSGLMFRDLVAQKTKIQVKWGAMSEADCSTLLQMVDDAFLTIKYPDAYTGAMAEMECYVGDRSTPMYQMDDNGNWVWQGVAFSFIER